jgi:hypothetical protein
MSSKVEACAVNGTDDDMAEHGGTIPENRDEQEVEACTNNGNVGAEHGEAAFAAVMAQLAPEGVRALHARVEEEWGPVLQSACQTAAARALWGRAVRDPAAGVLAGERFLRGLHEKMRRRAGGARRHDRRAHALVRRPHRGRRRRARRRAAGRAPRCRFVRKLFFNLRSLSRSVLFFLAHAFVHDRCACKQVYAPHLISLP